MDIKCDIVLLSYESPALLRECVESVLRNTRVPSRLIIVDNASKDPAVARYLHEVRGNGTVEVEKVFSETNAGFARGMNKGMRLSDAPFVCILNNDCVVAPGWLEEMIRVADSKKEIGLVNPQSNTFGSRPQAGTGVEEHVMTLADRKGRYVELGHAIGFACLVKREVMEKAGYFDEAYEGVCYEDTDYSARAQKEGYISVMAEGAYVFHHEQASRRGLAGKEEIYRRNRERFESRWGKLLRVFFFLDRPETSFTERGTGFYDVFSGVARERAIVEAWVVAGRLGDSIFRMKGFYPAVKHADVGLFIFTGGFKAPAALWRVLTKKKKYDAVVMKGGVLARVLRALKFLHGSEILVLDDEYVVNAEGARFDLKDAAALAAHLRARGGKQEQ